MYSGHRIIANASGQQKCLLLSDVLRIQRAHLILFVQLYELLLLLCSLLTDMYFNVFVLIHFLMCL